VIILGQQVTLKSAPDHVLRGPSREAMYIPIFLISLASEPRESNLFFTHSSKATPTSRRLWFPTTGITRTNTISVRFFEEIGLLEEEGVCRASARFLQKGVYLLDDSSSCANTGVFFQPYPLLQQPDPTKESRRPYRGPLLGLALVAFPDTYPAR
jgi:hypothetical protein